MGIPYEWDFGDGTTSKLNEPTHIYRHGGIYEVTLKAFSENGKRIDERTITITIENSLTFNNTTHTYLYVTINEIENPIPPGHSITLYDINDGLTYSAYTVGKKSNGNPIGETIIWDGIVNYSNQNIHTFEV